MTNDRVNLAGKELDWYNRKVEGVLNLSFINTALFSMLNKNEMRYACLLRSG